MTVDVYPVGDLHVWKMVIAAPAPILSTNATHNMHEMKISKWRKTWRQHTYELIQAANLPRHLARVHFSIAFHFTTYGRRDALNYADTAKPIIDAFGPPFMQKPTTKKPAGASAPGWSLIDDDDPIHIDATELFIGQHWGFIAAEKPTLPNLQALDNGHGGVTIMIRQCAPLPATHHHVARPKPPVIPADVRRRATLADLLGDQPTGGTP